MLEELKKEPHENKPQEVKESVVNQKAIPKEQDLYDAAKSGNLDLVKQLVRDFGFMLTEWVLLMATRSGNLELVKWLVVDNKLVFGKYCADRIVECTAPLSGNLKLMQWWLETYKQKPEFSTLDYAAESGSLALVQWLVETKGEKLTFSTLDYAAESGSLALVRWLVETKRIPLGLSILDHAKKSNNQNLVTWLENYLEEKRPKNTEENSTLPMAPPNVAPKNVLLPPPSPNPVASPVASTTEAPEQDPQDPLSSLQN